MSSPACRLRVALQLSGHLRDTCTSDNRDPLVRALALCNATFGHWCCTAFFHTWSHLSWAEDQTDVAHALAAQPSAGCAHDLRRSAEQQGVEVRALHIEQQNSSAAMAQQPAWLRGQPHLVSWLWQPYAMFRAGELRRSCEQTVGMRFALVIRLRYDLYRRSVHYSSGALVGGAWRMGQTTIWQCLRQRLAVLGEWAILPCAYEGPEVQREGINVSQALLARSSVRVGQHMATDNCHLGQARAVDRVHSTWLHNFARHVARLNDHTDGQGLGRLLPLPVTILGQAILAAGVQPAALSSLVAPRMTSPHCSA